MDMEVFGQKGDTWYSEINDTNGVSYEYGGVNISIEFSTETVDDMVPADALTALSGDIFVP